MSLLRLAVISLVFVVSINLVIPLFGCFHTTQDILIFCNWIRFPLYPKFHLPEHYGFAHNSVRNIKITTPDNVTLGVWHILPSEYYDKQDLREKEQVDESIYDAALMDHDHDTVIYFHGNSRSRAADYRVDFYKSLLKRYPKLNIVTFDYRGFGDSDGFPSEPGLQLDARAVYNWLISKKVPSNRITFIGHSLGTGVATTLAHDLTKIGTPPHALVVQAAYTSVHEAVHDYRLLGNWRPFWILDLVKIGEEFLKTRVRSKFDSLSRIADVDCPILIVAGNKDFEMPPIHSKRLFYVVLGMDPHLPHEQQMEKDPMIQVRQIENEALVYTRSKQSKVNNSSSSLVQLVYLEYANHNNFAHYDYLYKALDDATFWSKK
ncbi:Alpha/Beta hydrolase protein [Chlamydoabsidia padenii]|nr:Alpha/Beta hydrolase protein [Chlamydoabsidia padenii]